MKKRALLQSLALTAVLPLAGMAALPAHAADGSVTIGVTSGPHA